MALTPGVSPRCQATSRAQSAAGLALRQDLCGVDRHIVSQPSPKQQQQQQGFVDYTLPSVNSCLKQQQQQQTSSVGSLISFIRCLFIVGMRPFVGGGTDYARILLFTPIIGCGLTWFLQRHFFSVSLILILVILVFLQILLGLIRNSERLGFPTFCRSGQKDASLEEFNLEVDGWLPLIPEISLPELTGETLADVVRRKGATAGSLDGWGWREIKALLVAWYDGLARILANVGVWPEDLLNAYTAVIPKADVDATTARSVTVECASGCVPYLGFRPYGAAGRVD